MWNSNIIEEKLVLVVDDDSAVRESLAEILDAKGYSVLQAENGQKALDDLRETPHFPRVVLLDLAMPVMDGCGFLEHRAHDPILREIPVVVVSGDTQSNMPLEGIDAYLSKPVSIDSLIDIIDQYG